MTPFSLAMMWITVVLPTVGQSLSSLPETCLAAVTLLTVLQAARVVFRTKKALLAVLLSGGHVRLVVVLDVVVPRGEGLPTLLVWALHGPVGRCGWHVAAAAACLHRDLQWLGGQ